MRESAVFEVMGRSMTFAAMNTICDSNDYAKTSCQIIAMKPINPLFILLFCHPIPAYIGEAVGYTLAGHESITGITQKTKEIGKYICMILDERKGGILFLCVYMRLMSSIT